jgi:hypothetical protein
MPPFLRTTLRRQPSASGAICVVVGLLVCTTAGGCLIDSPTVDPAGPATGSPPVAIAANPPTAQAQNRGRYQLQLGDARDLLGPGRPTAGS